MKNFISNDLINNVSREVVIAVLVALVLAFLGYFKKKGEKKVNTVVELLSAGDKNSFNWKKDMIKALGIEETMREYFPEYKGYLLIQYGSSVKTDNIVPNDYDFIVLMLGYSDRDIKYLHNKGTMDIANFDNKNDVDIVFRDYNSFLFASATGMPYENSVVKHGKLLIGPEGYFIWLQNITKNILFDKDFLIKRFKDKIIIEKEEYNKCKNEYDKYSHDRYYVIRAGYYYITSKLQLKTLESFKGKILTQEDVVGLSNVKRYYNVFPDDKINERYTFLVEKLKRNNVDDEITNKDIEDILNNIESVKI